VILIENPSLLNKNSQKEVLMKMDQVRIASMRIYGTTG